MLPTVSVRRILLAQVGKRFKAERVRPPTLLLLLLLLLSVCDVDGRGGRCDASLSSEEEGEGERLVMQS